MANPNALADELKKLNREDAYKLIRFLRTEPSWKRSGYRLKKRGGVR